MKQTNKIEADELVKIASEGGEIQASEVSDKDERRLARLQ